MDAKTLVLGVSATDGIKQSQNLTAALKETGAASDIVVEATKRVTANIAATTTAMRGSSDQVFANSRVLKEEAIDLNSVDARWKALMQTMSGADTTTRKVTDATQKSAVAHAEAGASAEQSQLKLGRLQSGVVSLIGQLGGATQETRLLNGALTAFGAGSNPIALAALGSTAALAAAYEFLTTKTREQKKAQDDATESLKKYNAQQQLGFAGQQGDNLAKAEKKLQDLRDELDKASSAFSGDSAKNAQILADTQKRYDAQAAIVAAGEKNVANISREAYADNLADLARNNQLKGALYDQAVLLLKGNEKELADLQKQASSSFVVPDTVLQRIRELTDQDKNLYDALYPDPKKVKDAVDVLATLKKTVGEYIDEAASFGKENAIEKRTGSIVASLDQMEQKYPKLTAQIETLKASAISAGDALQKAFAADAAQKIVDAQNKITASLHERTEALRAELAAINSGASTRTTYAADLAYEKELQDANTISDKTARDARIAEAKANHDATVELDKRKEVLQALADLHGANPFDIPGAAEKEKKAAEERLKNLREALDLAKQIGDALSQSGSATGRGVGQALQVGSAVGSVGLGIATGNVSEVVGGVKDFIGALDLFGTHAKQAREALDAQTASFDAVARSIRASIDGTNDFSKTLDDVRQQFTDLRAAAPAVDTTHGAGVAAQSYSERIRQLTEINQLEADRVAQLTKEHDALLATASQSLDVRSLRASGDTAGADALSRTLDHLAEIKSEEDRLGVGADSPYIKHLIDVQAQEDKAADSAKALAAALALSDFNSNLDVRSLRASGNADGADALQRTIDHLAEIREAESKLGVGDDSPLIQHLKDVQAAEDAAADATKALAVAAEQLRATRSVADINNATEAFTDPRAAQEAAFLDGLQRRIEDATTPMEKLAQSTYATAAALDFYAKRLEADTRTSEGFASRVLTALGGGRDAEDFTRGISNRQASVDLANSGASQFNQDFLAFTQRAEKSNIDMQRAIEDGTTKLNAQAKADTDENNAINAQYQASAQAKLDDLDKEYNAQSDKFDGLIAAAQQQVTYAQQSLQLAQSQLAATQKAVDALATVNDSLKLSDLTTLSPAQKLAESKAQLDALVTAAQGGDRTAASGIGSAASAYLTQDKAFNGTSAQYGSDFASVQNTVSALQKQYNGLLGTDTSSVNSAQSALDSAQVQVGLLNDLKTATLDAIDARKNSISADAQHFSKDIDALNKTIADQLPTDIAQLVADQNAANLDRIKADPFYKDFSAFVSGAGFTFPTSSDPLPVLLAPATDTTLSDQLTEMRAQTVAMGKQLTELQNQNTNLIGVITALGALGTLSDTQTTTIVAALDKSGRKAYEGARRLAVNK